MAGDWFPMGFWRSRCPEVVLVSSLTSRDRHEVLGWLCDLWSWVSGESADGRVRGVRVRDLASVIGGDAALWEAVQAAGWLAEDPAGIVIPGWDTWLCESAKKRARERSKKRDQRSRPRPDSVPEVSPKCPRKSGTTEQNRRVHTKNPPLPPVPTQLDVPEFHAAWASWQAHRREIRKPLTPTTVVAQMRTLAAMGAARAVRCIEHTIAKGWTGLREPDAPAAGSAGGPTPPPRPLRAVTPFEIAHGHYDPHNGFARDAAGNIVLDRLCADAGCEHCKPRRAAA